MDLRTKKIMTIHNALHLGDDINRLYMSRKEGGIDAFTLSPMLAYPLYASMGDSVNASIRGLEDSIKRSKEDKLQRPETKQTS